MFAQNENRPVATGGFDTLSLFSSLDDQEIARKFVSAQAAYPSGAKRARQADGPLSQIRLQYFAERLRRLGPKALFHLLDELQRGADLHVTLDRYAAVPAESVLAFGGNKFARSFAIRGGRAHG
jgi:hypothetical protein